MEGPFRRPGTALPRNRTFTYEITACRHGRWTLDGVSPDEDGALAAAGGLLAADAEEVKVTRLRRMPGGFATRTEILHRKRPAGKDRPLAVGGPVADVPVCREPADLYALPARRAVSRLFRQFLDRHRITATELLHGWAWLRKLNEAGTLVTSASHQVAKVQAARTGEAAKARLAALDALVARGMERARDFAAERRGLPAFSLDDLPGSSMRILDRVGEQGHDFVFLAQFSLHLMQAGSIAGRQEMALDLLDRAGDDARVAALLEGVVADTLMTADAVKELLGPHPHLGASLAFLADFLNGRAAGSPIPALARIGHLMDRGHAACREVLVGRLLAELARDAPLDRRDPDQDAKLLDMVAARLRDGEGRLLGGEAAEEALARRRLRRHQAVLRGLGLEEQADRLPSQWRK